MVTFGVRLRELRTRKGLNQRDLAELVGVDFTYLSKLENERLPAPSATVIAALATALDTDADELAVLAGKIPADLVEVLRQNPGAIKMFRSLAGDIRSPEDWERHLRAANLPRSDEQ